MAYRGKTYQIPCNRGGMTHNRNADLVSPEMMVHPTRNININEGGRGPRGGTSHVNTTAVTSEPEITGLYDYTLQDGSQFIVFGTSGGDIYKDDTTTISTGLTADCVYNFEVMDNVLFIANGSDTPMTWNGSDAAVTVMTDIPTDWATVKPKQFIKHGRGASERMWALGFASGTVYASHNGDGDDFSDAHVISIKINTNDGAGIVGGVEYGDRLFAFGKTQTFIVDDSSATSSEWGYDKAQWEGGAAHHRLIVKTPNDIVCMMEDGNIYSVMAAENYGDYKQASLTAPSQMDRWIREHVRLSYISQFHAVYDPVLRAIKFFIVRNGHTTVDTAMVYFIDRPPEEAWVIHSNQTADSGYSARSSALVRKSEGVYKIYTGDYEGFMWELETANKNDNSEAFYAGFKTPNLTFGNAREDKMFNKLRLSLEPKGSYNLYVKKWIDGVVESTVGEVSLAGAGAVLDAFTLDTDSLSDMELIDTSLHIGRVGKRIQFEFYNSTADQSFFVSQAMVDFKPMGPKNN